jgi:hypothetical protein
VGARAERVPGWRILLDRALWPFRRMWGSDDPMDAYALVHMASAGGDALVAIALADSVFFSVPVSEAKLKVALYLGLTMAPLAVAAPLLVPLLDRTGFRRAISFGSAAGRAAAAVYAAPRFSSLLLFPLAFSLLVLSRVHAITKNGLTMGYAPAHEGLVRANARLGRIAVAGVVLAAPAGLLVLKLGGATTVLYLAAAAYGVTALLVFRLPAPDVPHVPGEVQPRGRVASLTAAAAGMAGLRGASGFLLFLMAFALRGRGHPAYWFGVLAGSALVGGFLGDLTAPRLPRGLREEVVVFGSLVAAGVAALFAVAAFELVFLALFAGLAGMATEFGRLAFQSLMQRSAPAGAHGRVFVRYEVLFQVSWVAGAFLPAILPIPFRLGVAILAVFYLAMGLEYLFLPVMPWSRGGKPGGTRSNG